MTQDDELLFKDLCARLPYGVIGQCELDKFDVIVYSLTEDSLYVYPLIENEDEQNFAEEEVAKGVDFSDFKPYLFPLSSITEKEWEDYQNIRMMDWVHGDINGTFINAGSIVDWLNAHHFDFRGLIEKGLAIDATGLNIY